MMGKNDFCIKEYLSELFTEKKIRLFNIQNKLKN